MHSALVSMIWRSEIAVSLRTVLRTSALRTSDSAKAMQDHCKGITKRYPLETPGGLQDFRVLTEADVLRLIVRSKLPVAEKFERWVFEEVLPAIRKTGSYNGPAIDPMKVVNDSTLTTDSRRVAKHFHKQHKNVLQAFDKLDCSDEYRLLNFQQTVDFRPNPSGGAPIQARVISMTKDGFIFLVMSFTGKEAARIKEAYIGAFNAMTDQLQQIAVNGFRDLWAQRLELETRDATTFQWASFPVSRTSQILGRHENLLGELGASKTLKRGFDPLML